MVPAILDTHHAIVGSFEETGKKLRLHTAIMGEPK